MGIGVWGLGIGDWGLGPIPNPQSPIPNPQSPFYFKKNFIKYIYYKYIKCNIKIKYIYIYINFKNEFRIYN